MALNNSILPFRRIWEKYFLFQMLKIFLLFLFGFYALYVMIDYSNHAGSFRHHHFSILDVLKFYSFEFFTRMNLLVPFALLIAFIKTVTTCNINNELVALLVAGIPLRRIMRPFILFALACVALIYLNAEILQPYILKYHNQLEASRAKKKQNKYKHPPIQQITLNDGSSLIFQHYDPSLKRFYDAYWVRSIDDIYRIKYLFPYTDVPTAETIEHFQRDPHGRLMLIQSLSKKDFHDMHFDLTSFLDNVSSPRELPISTLKYKLPPPKQEHTDKEAQILTAYYYKLAFPWICLLAVIAPAPLCTHFSRTIPIFFIYAGCIFALVAFYIVLDAAMILGERQVLPPSLAILGPFTLTFSFFWEKFNRL